VPVPSSANNNGPSLEEAHGPLESGIGAAARYPACPWGISSRDRAKKHMDRNFSTKWTLSRPRVHNVQSVCLLKFCEVFHVACDKAQAMYLGRSSNQTVGKKTWNRDMEGCICQCHPFIHRQHPPLKGKRHPLFQPVPQYLTCLGVIPCFKEDTLFQFHQCNCTDEEQLRRIDLRPSNNTRIGPTRRHCPKLTNNIGIQQVHGQEKSTSRGISDVRSTSKSMSAASGMASISMMPGLCPDN